MNNYKLLPVAGLMAAAAFGLDSTSASAAVPGMASQTVNQPAPIVEQVRYYRNGHYHYGWRHAGYRYGRHYGWGRHYGYGRYAYGYGRYGYGGRYCNRVAPVAAAAAATSNDFFGGLFGLGQAAVSVPGAVVGGVAGGYGYPSSGYSYGYGGGYPSYGYGYGNNYGYGNGYGYAGYRSGWGNSGWWW